MTTLASEPRGSATTGRTGRPARVSAGDIAAVAALMFGAHGLHGTSIAAVADRVGLTDAGVLHHFPSKAALLEAAETSAWRQVDRVRELVAPGGLTAIRAMASWGKVMAETPELTAFQALISADAVREDSPLREVTLDRYAGVHDLICRLIGEGVERGEIRPEADAEWEASSLIAFLDGIRLQWLYSDGALDLEKSVERYFTELVDRLAAP